MPECTKVHHFDIRNPKIFWGRGTPPPQTPPPVRRGTPLPTPHPLRRLDPPACAVTKYYLGYCKPRLIHGRTLCCEIVRDPSYIHAPYDRISSEVTAWDYNKIRQNNLFKFCFTNRIVNIWNSLPSYVVSAKTVNCFKTRLDRFWLNQDIIYNFRSEIHGVTSINRNRKREAAVKLL